MFRCFFVNVRRFGTCGTYRVGSFVYSGQLNNNKKKVYGRLVSDKSADYEGEFLNDKKHGKGHIDVSKNLITYKGEFMNDKKHGFGHLSRTDKFDYEGEFKNDLFDGKGVLKTYSKMTETMTTIPVLTTNLNKENSIKQVEFMFSDKTNVILEINEMTEFGNRIILKIPIFKEEQKANFNHLFKFTNNTSYSIEIKKMII